MVFYSLELVNDEIIGKETAVFFFFFFLLVRKQEKNCLYCLISDVLRLSSLQQNYVNNRQRMFKNQGNLKGNLLWRPSCYHL